MSNQYYNDQAGVSGSCGNFPCFLPICPCPAPVAQKRNEAAWFGATGAQVIAPNAPVVFNTAAQPAVLPDAFSVIPPSTVTINERGQYLVWFTALPGNSNVTLALFLDGVEVPGSRFVGLTSAGSLNGFALITVAKADVPADLQLRNVDPVNNATIQAGPLADTLSVALTILKL